MAYGRRSQTTSSLIEGFTLNPLPYPVLIILLLLSLFLGFSWYSSYESAVEEAESNFNWLLLLTPIALLLIVQFLSSMEPDWLFAMSPWERRRRTHNVPSEGSSPWGVAAVIVVLLVLLQFQSGFRDSWLI